MSTAQKQLTIYKCMGCGKNLPAGRRDKKYHGAACRMKAKRWRDKMSRAARDAKKAITTVAGYMDFEETRTHAYHRLKLLRQYANQCIERYETEREALRHEN